MIKGEVKKKLGKLVLEWFVKNPKRVYLTIDKKDLKEAAKILYKDFKMRFSTASGIDNEGNFEIIYHFGYDGTGELFNLRVFIQDKKNPEIDSLTGMFKASSWIEREIHEMLGINFKGHPDLKHLLLEDWPKGEYPLRKDCKLGESYPIKEDK